MIAGIRTRTISTPLTSPSSRAERERHHGPDERAREADVADRRPDQVGGEPEDRADAEVDLPGDDDERLADRNDHHERGVVRISVIIAGGAERGYAGLGDHRHEHDQGDQAGLVVTEQPADRRRRAAGSAAVGGAATLTGPPAADPGGRLHHRVGVDRTVELGDDLARRASPPDGCSSSAPRRARTRSASPPTPLRASSATIRSTSAFVPTSIPWVGSSRISSRRPGGQPLAEHDLLLVAPRQRARRAGRSAPPAAAPARRGLWPDGSSQRAEQPSWSDEPGPRSPSSCSSGTLIVGTSPWTTRFSGR